jgi:hypothetical protein
MKLSLYISLASSVRNSKPEITRTGEEKVRREELNREFPYTKKLVNHALVSPPMGFLFRLDTIPRSLKTNGNTNSDQGNNNRKFLYSAFHECLSALCNYGQWRTFEVAYQGAISCRAAYNLIICYASKWDRLYNGKTIPYSYTKSSLMPLCGLGKAWETGPTI